MPRSSRVQYSTLTPASIATSPRRSPATRRSPCTGSPACGRDPVAAGAQERGGLFPVVHARQPRQAAPVALRWLLQHGIPLVAKSTDPGRLRRNIAVFDFELSPDELAAIAQLDCHQPGLGFTHQDPRMPELLLKYA
ncbi:aldo/keto reductase [Kitasatospora sp. NPDC051984]|uniref:aldo/keto reductase n=1 Tax=Kitasatospora sp. NPDC051984 TaxID=3364059 RepID=UPI0037C602B5